MVARSRTNAQIAPPSCASASALCPRTWTGIRDETGCRRRADLTRLALTAGLV